MSPWCIKSIFPILNRILSFTESPLWLLLQVAPIRNERDLVVLLLLTFRDITAFKQLIDAEDSKSGKIDKKNKRSIVFFFQNFQMEKEENEM